MASSSNGNLVDDFEESFQACIHAMTKHDAGGGTSGVVDKDEIGLDVDQTTVKFVDLARQMESFFIQKRFLLSAMKPELVLKEENFDLRYEMSRKDDLIRRHYEKIDQWKAILSDLQQQSGNTGGIPSGPTGGVNQTTSQMGGVAPNMAMAQGQTAGPGLGGMGSAGVGGGGTGVGGGPMGMGGGVAMGVGGGGIPAMQAQLQAQQQQQHMQQQQMLQAQQQMHMQQQMQVGSQQMFMQQGGTGGPSGQLNARGGGGVGGFPASQQSLQNPLAFLEKTTSNIDLVGMGDGRR